MCSVIYTSWYIVNLLMNRFATASLLFLFALPSSWAARSVPMSDTDGRIEVSEFEPAGTPGGGFLTDLLNNSLERAAAHGADSSQVRPALGRRLTDYVSVPKFGAYFIGKYAYSDREGAHGGDGFSQRFIRAYVDGTILGDFHYRLQAQVNNSSFHMKDYFLEWCHWKELAVKVGQFKRAFLFENPYNPWDVGLGDYSLIARHLAGIADKDGSVSNGGRDQGLQIQGDLFPSRKDGHRYLHYQLQVMNGQGINAGDANRRKDLIGTLQVQPVTGLRLGLFAWNGNYVSEGITVDRKRWAVAVNYEHNGWSARAEYAHSKGHQVSDYDKTTDTWKGTGHADGWYAAAGVPCTSWLKIYLRYDAYRSQKTWQSLKTIYSLCPNIQLHKNLLIQLQYNHVHDRQLTHADYNELWGELYVRF